MHGHQQGIVHIKLIGSSAGDDGKEEVESCETRLDTILRSVGSCFTAFQPLSHPLRHLS